MFNQYKQQTYAIKELLKILIEDFTEEQNGDIIMKIDKAILGQIKATIEFVEEELKGD